MMKTRKLVDAFKAKYCGSEDRRRRQRRREKPVYRWNWYWNAWFAQPCRIDEALSRLEQQREQHG